MAILQDIQSPVWTLSTNGGGSIAEGMQAIRQCVDIIVRTTKGTDPLRPEFGSDIAKFQDYPLNVAIPNMKKAILDAISLWEPRVVFTSIGHTLSDNSNIQFILTYKLADSSLTDSVSFAVGNGGIITGAERQRLILRGFFPPNPASFQYQIACSLDGSDLLPSPPSNGFETIDDMYAWVQTNWLNAGQWYLNGNSIVGYMDPVYLKGEITVSILARKRFGGLLPALPVGYKYSLDIIIGVKEYTATDFYTPQQVLSYVSNHPEMGKAGEWQIITNDGSFNEDFMEDFDLYTQYLQLLTETVNVATINISVIPQ